MPINGFLYPGASGPPTPYEVANSLRFSGSGSDDYLNRSLSSNGNRKIWTCSAWTKRVELGRIQIIMFAGPNGTDSYPMYFRNDDRINSAYYADGGFVYRLETNAVFRDVGTWMHIVVAFDSTQSTESNRVKMYVNGTQITSFKTASYPSLNAEYSWNNSAYNHRIGYQTTHNDFDYHGYLTELVHIDGQALDQTSFGEFDEKSPNIWKPIDVSGLTFGTNGFYLDFEDSSALGNDVSGNDNDFSVNNLAAVDQSTDTCTNNFITLNPLEVTTSTGRTLSEGNLTYTSDSSNASSARGTFGVNSGKWYYEVKIVSQSGSASSTGKFGTFGFHDISEVTDPQNDGLTIIADSRLRGQGSTPGSQAGSSIWGVGDILMFALDLDNQNLYVGKNGNWRASDGDFDDSSPSSAIFSSIDTTKFWTPFGQKNVSANNTLSYSMNFGSPSFSISSGNSDANGHGNFEYAVPSGYYSLNTKNLAEFG